MPLWTIYHSDSIFKDDSTTVPLADAITKLHVREIGFPAFYVVTIFVPVKSGKLLVGGRNPEKPFVRISIDQIALKMAEDLKAYKKWTAKIDEMLEPHIAAKWYDSEYHINETEKMLWKVNGTYAPPFGSVEEKKWIKANRVLPREVPYDQIVGNVHGAASRSKL
ncbi:putative oxalocrotonate tautomerase [Leptodontidium sp. MPI-SDFR-AT-0119]|nr:putative oxalocrotonate tautomerase [Leptodontidium sp. MPI-SDFR-AT-0119]